MSALFACSWHTLARAAPSSLVPLGSASCLRSAVLPSETSETLEPSFLYGVPRWHMWLRMHGREKARALVAGLVFHGCRNRRGVGLPRVPLSWDRHPTATTDMRWTLPHHHVSVRMYRLSDKVTWFEAQTGHLLRTDAVAWQPYGRRRRRWWGRGEEWQVDSVPQPPPLWWGAKRWPRPPKQRGMRRRCDGLTLSIPPVFLQVH